MKEWPTKPLGEVAQVVSGATPRTGVPEFWDGDIVWLTPKDLGRLASIEVAASERRITQTGFESCSAQMVPPGSVVMSSRAPIGHLAINTVAACTNQGCKSFVPGTAVNNRYLYWTLKAVMPDIRHLGQGCTFEEVSKTDLQQFPIPLPSLAEQRRLVTRIEALTARLAQARQARQEAVAEADELTNLTQRNTYERLLEDCDAAPLSEIGQVFGGCTPSKARAEYWDGDVPWIAPKEMKVFRIGDSSVRLTRQAVDDEVVRLLPSPVVLMVVRGMILAKRVPVAVTTQPASINQDMKAFRPRKGIDAEFLAHMLCGAGEELKGRVEVAGHGTCKLETEAWGSLPIPIPEVSTQRRIVARLDALAAKQNELRRLQSATDAALATFTPALLAKAFRGEL
jgi:type I restriction enzyme S subunit